MRVLPCLLAAVAACSADPMIWPLPASYTNGSSLIGIDGSSFTFKATTASADLTAAFARYTARTFPHRPMVTSGIATATVAVQNPAAELQLGVDESYTLSVTQSGISITAATQFGAYYAMETLSQLVIFDFDTQAYVVRNGPWTINDKPRFSHREVLIDSSRHFEPVETLKHIIESFTYAKINTMHWHLVDEQSFPYDSPTYPKLGQMGAYSNFERFSQNDVQDVVEFARQRGVRVVIEVDTPGHAASWCKGHPEICPSPSCLMPLNPATNATFDLIEGLFKDLKAATIDNHFHIGGDEVNTGCWTSTPSIQQWMTQQNYTADQAYAYFSGRVSDIVFGMNRSVTGWEELWDHFGTKLDKRTIIQQWLPGSNVSAKAIAAGYRAIWTADPVWYLPQLGETWQIAYQQEPCVGIENGPCNELMLGGGGEMWGETVDTSDIQNTIWPRMAAIAERLWSPRTVTDLKKAAPRIAYFRCLLNRRGVGAAPVNNAQARQAPPGPGSCFDQ
eukprot:TRINITY_DN382_c0_g3_i1.p1 TRINITY_DN382_c0_g3~~TRINITY_DN382_c0_g3_i1.p1  ORF type:complete len:505 (+),score=168.63 TRINITY_DN382_c0_g3_i1:79-1593(+)